MTAVARVRTVHEPECPQAHLQTAEYRCTCDEAVTDPATVIDDDPAEPSDGAT